MVCELPEGHIYTSVLVQIKNVGLNGKKVILITPVCGTSGKLYGIQDHRYMASSWMWDHDPGERNMPHLQLACWQAPSY